MARKKISFHQDDAPCHKSPKTTAKLYELGFELLPHPPYSPDLVPSDYWLFAQLKKMARWEKISFQQRGDHRMWDVFCMSRQIILQKRYWNVRKTLDWLYHSSRELCWWIETIFGKHYFFLHLPRDLLIDVLSTSRRDPYFWNKKVAIPICIGNKKDFDLAAVIMQCARAVFLLLFLKGRTFVF